MHPSIQPIRCSLQLIKRQSQQLDVLLNVRPIIISHISLLTDDCRVANTVFFIRLHPTFGKTFVITRFAKIIVPNHLEECPKVTAPWQGAVGSKGNNVCSWCWPSTAYSLRALLTKNPCRHTCYKRAAF